LLQLLFLLVHFDQFVIANSPRKVLQLLLEISSFFGKFFAVFKGLIFLVIENVDFFFQIGILRLKSLKSLPVISKGGSDFGLNNLVEALNLLLRRLELFFVSVAHLDCL
jgi:hypothetical protein